MDSITLTIKAMPVNESLARSLIAAYAARVNPTVDIISDIKTAVSEAVTNAVIHAYAGDAEKEIRINASIRGKTLSVAVEDFGVGIPDVIEAMGDFYTSKPADERSGLGFTIMGSFMDSLEVKSVPGEGTTIVMTKQLA